MNGRLDFAVAKTVDRTRECGIPGRQVRYRQPGMQGVGSTGRRRGKSATSKIKCVYAASGKHDCAPCRQARA